jgi:hypothetical protein
LHDVTVYVAVHSQMSHSITFSVVTEMWSKCVCSGRTVQLPINKWNYVRICRNMNVNTWYINLWNERTKMKEWTLQSLCLPGLHCDVFCCILILWGHEKSSLVEDIVYIVVLFFYHHRVVIQHLVSDRLFSLISNENLHNIR